MGLLFILDVRVPSMTFITGHTVFLMDRSRPTMGSYAHKTADRKLGMALDAGIRSVFIRGGIRRFTEYQGAAQDESADENAITYRHGFISLSCNVAAAHR